MNEELYIAVARFHRQPPIETPAEITTRTKAVRADATVHDIWEWAMSYVGKDGYTTLTSLEIRPDE